MRTKLLPIRRWGVAVLSGVTLLGAVAVLGEGAASASTVATVTVSTPTGLAPSASNASVGNVVITESAAGNITAGNVCLHLSGGAFAVANSSGTYETITVTGPTGAVVTAPTHSSELQNGDLTFAVTTPSTTAGAYTVSGIYVTAPSGPGQYDVTATYGASADCSTSPGTALTGSPALFGVEGALPSIYGQSADATTAQEFASTWGSCNVGNTAVLATDADPYDALAAATLETSLHSGDGTGVLITPPTSLDPNTLQEIAAQGIETIYVVGGPLAISNADIAALQATSQSGQCGSNSASKINVISGIYGQTADATAFAIDSEARTIGGGFGDVNLTAVTPTTYNDTTQTGSATGVNGTTAIVTSDTDFQDPAAAGGIAFDERLPILLTPSTTLGPDATAGLEDFGINQVILIGGQLAVAPAVVTAIEALGIKVVPIAGLTYTDSAAELAKFETANQYVYSNTLTATGLGLGWNDNDGLVLLTQGAQVNDALGAAALSGEEEAPVILTASPSAGLDSYGTAELGKLGAIPNQNVDTYGDSEPMTEIQPLGGPLALPTATITAALNALA